MTYQTLGLSNMANLITIRYMCILIVIKFAILLSTKVRLTIKYGNLYWLLLGKYQLNVFLECPPAKLGTTQSKNWELRSQWFFFHSLIGKPKTCVSYDICGNLEPLSTSHILSSLSHHYTPPICSKSFMSPF